MNNSIEKEIDVSVDKLTKKFGLFTAVDEVSFSVPRGEFFSILGPSGCGKTTLLRMISGFEVPTRGDIYIGRERVNDIPPNKRRTNLIFQNLALFPLKSVYENIAFGLRRRRIPKGEIRKKVSRMLDRVGLPGFENKAIHQLSGGQKQRAFIARALMQKAEVYFMDEPFSGVDLQSQEVIGSILQGLRDEGKTLFVVHHGLEQVADLFDWVIFINRSLVGYGSVEETFTPEMIRRAFGSRLALFDEASRLAHAKSQGT